MTSSDSFSKKRIVFGVVGLLVVGFVLGLLVNYIWKNDSPDKYGEKLDMLTREADDKWSSMLIQSVNAANIRNNLRELTKQPHLAGTPADKKQAEELSAFWDGLGIKSHMTRYDVLLSYPDADNPNRIELQDGNGNPLFTTQLYEKILRPDQNQSNVVPPFNAFSAPGTPKGELLYVNYGRIEDFIWLQEEKGVEFEGKICISRYGKIFRGDKVKHAARYGCIGVILFSDPQQYSGGDPNNAYPKSWWLPPTGVQRGNVRTESTGDALTSGYPSIDSAYRINENDTNLPRIPVHPIGYGDAYMLLKDLNGEEAPEDWQGGLNFTYRLGPGFTQSERKVQMFISTHNQIASIYNAFGIIKGTIEPDRYVLLGNHRDAWVFGSVDPSSGTASMMELSRVFASMLKKGWKPRRTIMFCSWAAEEYSLVGSKEFVEHYRQMLSSRAVAYLNVDAAMDGRFRLEVGALPLLFNVARDAAKKIPNPDVDEKRQGRNTIYDTWLHRFPELNRMGQSTGKPGIKLLGSGSDFDPFIIKTGIPCVSTTYTYDESRNPSSYPLYHTVYETFHLVDTIMDPGFKYHKAVTQYWGELAWRLADSAVLPMKAADYSAALEGYATDVTDKYGDLMRQHGLSESIGYLLSEVSKMKDMATKYDHHVLSTDTSNPMEVRMHNDQLMHLERTFIDPLGLPGRKYTKHVIFAPSIHNRYAGSTFPGLIDALFNIDKTSGIEEIERWDKVKQQLSVLTYFIHAAANNLKNFAEL